MAVRNYEKEIPLSTSAPGAQFQAAALNVNKDQSKGLQQGSLVTLLLYRDEASLTRDPPTWKTFAPGLQSQQLACNFRLIYFELSKFLSQWPGFVHSG